MATKFENLILYICKKGRDDSRLGRTKLNKLLYYADFDYYRDTGSSVSGEEYMAIENGPVPRAMKPVLEAMIRAGLISEEQIYIGLPNPMRKPIARVEPDLSDFSPEEISHVDEIIQKFWQLTGSELSNLTHAQLGYCAAGMTETVRYATAYLPVFSMINSGDRARLQELSEAHGWREKYAA